MPFDTKIPEGPLAEKWDRHLYELKLANRSFGGAQVSHTFYTRVQTGQQLLLGAYRALSRQVSCGGYFNEAFQADAHEARRDDENFCHAVAWELPGDIDKPQPHKEPLVLDRSAFDTIIQAIGYISVNTGGAPDGNAVAVPQADAEKAMDAAACIGCGSLCGGLSQCSSHAFPGIQKLNNF